MGDIYFLDHFGYKNGQQKLIKLIDYFLLAFFVF